MTKREKEIIKTELELKERQLENAIEYYNKNPDYYDGNVISNFRENFEDFKRIAKLLKVI